jgi:hypothetical protein
MCHNDVYQRKFTADPNDTKTVTNILGQVLISKKNVTVFSDYFDYGGYFPDYLNRIRCAHSFYWVFKA